MWLPGHVEQYNDPYGQHPVVWVNQTQAAIYCGWANGRLPTEAQWNGLHGVPTLLNTAVFLGR